MDSGLAGQRSRNAERLCQQFVGAAARHRVMRPCDHHQFLNLQGVRERTQLVGHLLRTAYQRRAAQPVGCSLIGRTVRPLRDFRR